MKVYAITENTLKTGVIEAVEGHLHESDGTIFVSPRPGELTRFYKRQGDRITTEFPKNYEGFFELNYAGARMTAIRMITATIREKMVEIRDLRKITVR